MIEQYRETGEEKFLTFFNNLPDRDGYTKWLGELGAPSQARTSLWIWTANGLLAIYTYEIGLLFEAANIHPEVAETCVIVGGTGTLMFIVGGIKSYLKHYHALARQERQSTFQ